MVMTNVVVTLPWLTTRVAWGFVRAMRPQTLRIRGSIKRGARRYQVPIKYSSDWKLMRRRAYMVGRALADIAKRDGLKVLAPLDLPVPRPGEESAWVKSEVHGVSLRVVKQYHGARDLFFYRADILGARR